jgi:hypothetical protein
MLSLGVYYRQQLTHIFMYVLVVLPLELAFAAFEENGVTGTICTLVFVVDIAICFRTGISIKLSPLLLSSHAKSGILEGTSGVVELRPNVVAMRYVKGTSSCNSPSCVR